MEQAWSPQDLRARLRGVLEAAADGLVRLDDYTAHWPDEEDGFLRLQDKVAAEALLLAFLATRVPESGEPSLSGTISALVDQAERRIVTGRNEALLRRFPQTAVTVGVAYALLDRMGRCPPHIARLLRGAIRRGLDRLAERPTYRLMDARWTYGVVAPGLLPPAEALLPLSTLAAAPHPIYTMSEDDYAITHALYYLTDFGQRAPSPDLRSLTDALVDPYLAWNAVRGDWDLLGEFLIASLVLRARPTPSFRFAWDVFFRVWSRQEGLTGPEFEPEKHAQLAGTERDAYAFASNYHTVFVGGILCAVALAAPPAADASNTSAVAVGPDLAERCEQAARRARGAASVRAPSVPPRPADAPPLEQAVAGLLTVLGQGSGESPPWLRAALESPQEREELGPVLYDALLVAAVRAYRLVYLAEALAVGARHRALQSATFVRALEFLLDQQVESGLVGVHALLAERGESERLAGPQVAMADALDEVADRLREHRAYA